MSREFVPRPRSLGVLSEKVDGETLLYVERTHQASCLNAPAARIWALLDGKRNVETIAGEAKLDPDVVRQALRQLADGGLLENGAELGGGVNLSRRRVLVGVGLAAIPIIFLVTAPHARAAGSCTVSGGTCNPLAPNTCCSGECTLGVCG